MTDHQGTMSDDAPGVPGVPPRWVFSFFNPIVKFLLAAGVPMGPNGLITIRRRKSGLPRTTPVAIIEVSGRRWVWAPWGEVNGCGICALPAARPSPCAAGKKTCDRAGPDTASRVLSRHPRPARARHTVRCLVHSHRRWGRSRPSVGSGRGSACLRTPPTSMKVAAEAGDRASCADSRTPPNLVLGASLQQPLREVGALTQLRERQLDRAGAGVELPGPVAVAAVDPLLRDGAVGSATDRVGLSRHQRVDERGQQLAQQIRACLVCRTPLSLSYVRSHKLTTCSR